MILQLCNGVHPDNIDTSVLCTELSVVFLRMGKGACLLDQVTNPIRDFDRDDLESMAMNKQYLFHGALWAFKVIVANTRLGHIIFPTCKKSSLFSNLPHTTVREEHLYSVISEDIQSASHSLYLTVPNIFHRDVAIQHEPNLLLDSVCPAY